MKIYLPCIEGYVPDDMVRTMQAFLDFVYIVRQETHNESSLRELENALRRFKHSRQVFLTTGVRKDFKLPCQHSMVHYLTLI